MNRREKDDLLRLQLHKNLEILQKTKAVLDISFEKCKPISLTKELSEKNLESFEALTARFARYIDIASQKVLKTIFLLLRENPGAVIDQAALAEKLKIIPSAALFLELREMRNLIAHEYAEEDLRKLFKGILRTKRDVDALFKRLTGFCRSSVWTRATNRRDGRIPAIG